MKDEKHNSLEEKKQERKKNKLVCDTDIKQISSQNAALIALEQING